MVVGLITRESIREALSHGITASQIIQYLTQNAHRECYKSEGPLVPLTVVDQIRLWEVEKERLQLKHGNESRLLFF